MAEDLAEEDLDKELMAELKEELMAEEDLDKELMAD